MAKQVLENSGYSVLLAENGRDAVEIFQHSPREIATVLLEVRPLFGLVVTSGYAGNYRYDVSADGQRFLVALPERQQASTSFVTVVQNWQSGLKK